MTVESEINCLMEHEISSTLLQNLSIKSILS
jgi:hypothetical protein